MRSILFNQNIPDDAAKIPFSACEDLALTLLFSDDVTDIMRCPPSAENISLRREMFAEILEKPTLLSSLRELEALLSSASEMYLSQNRAICEAVEIYIFPHLFMKFSRFAEIAATLKADCAALSEFSRQFKTICEDARYINAKTDVHEVLNQLTPASTFYIKTESESVRLQKQNETDITESLYDCARQLGFDDIAPRYTGNLVLQKGIAEAVQKLSPSAFESAAAFYREFRVLVSGEIFSYLAELRFILGIADFTEMASNAGIPHSFPKISDSRVLSLTDIYDITLLKKEGTVIIPNDASFSPSEPFFYLTGANGGGKTTYLRAVGCAVMLFLCGAPVFCTGGECPVFDSVLTHFPRDERFEGSGRFFDEIRRVEELLSLQSGNSLILLNETYATTGEDKAREYTDELARKLYNSGNYGFYITHQHDVREAQIPFLGVVIDETDRNRRTYRIEKRRLPPKSFARDILEKYGLTKALLSLKRK